MFKEFFKTGSDWTGLILRLTLAIVLFPHGAQKVFGWFEGSGFTATMQGFTEGMGLPWIVAFLVVLVEFLGPISLLIGFAIRFWAIAIAIEFLGIILTAHVQYGFFMNWHGNKQGEGYEYHLLFIGLALALLTNGSGKWSADKALYKNDN